MNNVTEYFYVNPTTLQPTLKVQRIDGESGKKFIQYHLDGSDWKLGKPKEEIAPYKYEEWYGTQETIFIVEGEKCADRLKKEGLHATTTPGGSSSWKSDFAIYFEGKDVVILPDNDSPGKKYALNVAQDLFGVVKSLKQVELTSLETKEDVYDYLERQTIDELLLEIQNTEEINVVECNETPPQKANESLFPIEDLPPLIKDATELFAKSSDGSKAGCATAVFAVLSSLAARQFKFKGVYLNDYYLLVGKSGIARKTTIQNFGKKLLDEVLSLRPDLRAQKAVSEPGKIDTVEYSAIEEITTFSVEGLQEVLKGNGVSLLLTPPEYREVLSVSKRSGQSNTIPVLTSMYDGGKIKLSLRERKLTAENFSTTMLAASTRDWLDELFEKDNTAGGFLNRHLICFCEPSAEFRTDTREITRAEWIQLATRFASLVPQRQLTYDDNCKTITVGFESVELQFENKKAENVYLDFAKDNHERMRSEHNPDYYSDVVAREDAHAKKIAGLYAIASGKQTVDAKAMAFGIATAKSSSEVLLSYAGKSHASENANNSKLLKKITELYHKIGRPITVGDISRSGGKQDENHRSLVELLGTRKIIKSGNGYIPAAANSN